MQWIVKYFFFLFLMQYAVKRDVLRQIYSISGDYAPNKKTKQCRSSRKKTVANFIFYERKVSRAIETKTEIWLLRWQCHDSMRTRKHSLRLFSVREYYEIAFHLFSSIHSKVNGTNSNNFMRKSRKIFFEMKCQNGI